MNSSLRRTLTFLSLVLLCACDKKTPPDLSLEVAAQGIHAAALSDKHELALIGSIQHGGSLWQHADRERIFNWNHKRDEATTIIATDFSPEGDWALTATATDLVLWNTKTGSGDRFWSAPGEILDAKLGPGADFAMLGLNDHAAVIFDVQRGGILTTLPHNNRVRSVDVSHDGRLALTGSEDYSARLWEVENGTMLHEQKHEDDVQLVRLSPDGSLALSVSKYDRALIWETATGEIHGELPLNAERLKRGLRFISAKFSEDNSLLLTGRPDQIIELWDITLLEKITSWQAPKRRAWKPTGAAILDVSFAGEKMFHAIASNGFVHTLTMP